MPIHRVSVYFKLLLKCKQIFTLAVLFTKKKQQIPGLQEPFSVTTKCFTNWVHVYKLKTRALSKFNNDPPLKIYTENKYM